eukprot:c24274_g2_i1 orf=1985-2566(+)
MGKSKLFKALLGGMKAFKSPSKEPPTENPPPSVHSPSPCEQEEKEHQKRTHKEKRRWSLGKSSSRNRDVELVLPSFLANANEIKNLQEKQLQFNDTKLNIHSVAHPQSEACEWTLALSNNPDVAIVSSCNYQAATDVLQDIDREEWAAIKIETAFRGYLVTLCFLFLHILPTTLLSFFLQSKNESTQLTVLHF